MSIQEVVSGIVARDTSNRDLMVDLETLGLSTNTVVLSIGATFFDLETDTMGPTFYRNIIKQSCIDLGMTVDQSTVDWWSKQGPEAQAAFKTPAPMHVSYVMQEFRQWVMDWTNGQIQVWSNGASFDLAILGEIARRTGIKMPWAYWMERDTRTLAMVAERRHLDSERPLPTIAHHALHDAIAQASWMQNVWKVIHG